MESLVNGRSIAFDDRPQLVEVFHLELDRHAILIADGAPAESYRDDGNGVRFHTPRPDGACAPPPCAPILTCGPVVDRLWRRIADRAGIAAVATTREPDLHLLADGRRVDARLAAAACTGSGCGARRAACALSRAAACPARWASTPIAAD